MKETAVCLLISTFKLGENLEEKHLRILLHTLLMERFRLKRELAKISLESPLNLLFILHFCLNKNRTTVHLCTTPDSMTMTEMMWVTAVTTARTTVTRTRQIQTAMERETPVLWTLMEMVST